MVILLNIKKYKQKEQNTLLYRICRVKKLQLATNQQQQKNNILTMSVVLQPIPPTRLKKNVAKYDVFITILKKTKTIQVARSNLGLWDKKSEVFLNFNIKVYAGEFISCLANSVYLISSGVCKNQDFKIVKVFCSTVLLNNYFMLLFRATESPAEKEHPHHPSML